MRTPRSFPVAFAAIPEGKENQFAPEARRILPLGGTWSHAMNCPRCARDLPLLARIPAPLMREITGEEWELPVFLCVTCQACSMVTYQVHESGEVTLLDYARGEVIGLDRSPSIPSGTLTLTQVPNSTLRQWEHAQVPLQQLMNQPDYVFQNVMDEVYELQESVLECRDEWWGNNVTDTLTYLGGRAPGFELIGEGYCPLTGEPMMCLGQIGGVFDSEYLTGDPDAHFIIHVAMESRVVRVMATRPDSFSQF
jgi:hypothetical protein